MQPRALNARLGRAGCPAVENKAYTLVACGQMRSTPWYWYQAADSAEMNGSGSNATWFPQESVDGSQMSQPTAGVLASDSAILAAHCSGA